MAYPDEGRWESAPNYTLEQGFMRHSRFKRRKIPPSKPKRPVTGYDVFFRNTYPQVKKNNPSMSQQQLYSYIGRLWRENTTWQDRQICYDFADDEKDKYYAEVKEWRKKREKILEFDREASKAAKERREKLRNRVEIELQDVGEELPVGQEQVQQQRRDSGTIKWKEIDDCNVQ